MPSRLSSNRLRAFKTEATDENALISSAIRQLMPRPAGGIVLDVGAGLGDIAANAFPDRRAVLIDLLDFGPPSTPLHRRETVDFFQFALAGERIDVLVLSHVTQYIDDDLDKFVQTIRNLDPAHIIVVANSSNELDAALDGWFDDNCLSHNAEQPFNVFPLPEYVASGQLAIVGTLHAASFEELADNLATVIYDADLTREKIAGLANWLGERLTSPLIQMPQTISLYKKDIPVD